MISSCEEKDLFILSSSIDGVNMLYSPKRGVGCFVKENDTHEVIKYINDKNYALNEMLAISIDNILNTSKQNIPYEADVEILDKTAILLNQSCNLRCSYCYASKARATERLSKDKFSQLIQYVFNNRTGKKKVFSFLGGGEPLYDWGYFKWCVEEIISVSCNYDNEVLIGLTTNGTLLNEERIQWLVKNNVKIGISFDILPDIQNKQRPLSNRDAGHLSFDIVDRNIRLLIKHNANFKIRSTITKANVDRMTEMLLFAYNNYKGIKELHFEPVCDEMDNDSEFYTTFVTSFIETFNQGRQLGILVANSLVNSFFHIREHYCVGELCVTPEGDIVACHRFSSKNDFAFNIFQYGIIDSAGVHIDLNKLDDVIRFRSKKEECNKCFAKWNCAGGCSAIKATLSQKQHKEYCNFMQNFIKKLLEYKLLNN